ncbi:hypothetical protein SGQ44_12135 [Flavobacterium sp. Fl-77]|uniref:Transposase n=1 Tax=Flavobacterium flavipigmentatum TaxID=2893884 RepID=A0AAJ2S8F0_9FLAO|nr:MULTISPECIES: hypothetical protein [unclassified Flavobacterium]MDX6183229.1 hypothetical protein [Flavobacterium sp. Fl-33]MDX6186513.1 hypothetical protein [Flavobacterium sp. Fl-77]UFH38717.1 hypothetical protein LNP22_00165 [Flavobacterium sp. F-70]
MESLQERCYLKRTQKDYSMSLKLEIVQEIEQGQLTVDQDENLWSDKNYA